jgi:hypothetical protein
MTKRTLIVIAFSLFFFACSNKTEKKPRIVGNSDFSIEIPDYLKESDMVASDGLIQYYIKENDCFFYFVVFEDKKSDYETDFGLKEFYEYIANDILHNYLDYGSLNPPIDTVINGIKAKQFEIYGSLKIPEGDNNVVFLETIYEMDSVFFEVRSWCCYKGKEKYLKDMRKIAASFKLKSQSI